MTTSLYDLSVGSYQQAVSGMNTVLNKGAEFAEANDIDVNSFVNLRLKDDMLPFLFQVVCVRLHTVDAIAGIQGGQFSPPKSLPELDYAGLQALIAQTSDELSALDPGDVNALAGKTIVFKMGELEMPFTAENFVMSFSIPNLQFHAATAYDLLRAQGVPLGKADFLGQMRIGV